MGTVSLAVPLVPTELPSFLPLLLYHPTTEEEEGNVLLCRRNSSSVMSVKIAFILKLQNPIGELSFLPSSSSSFAVLQLVEEEEETAKNNRGNFFHLNRICMSLPGLLAKELWPLTRVPTAHPPDTSWGPSHPPLWVTSKSCTYREVLISLTSVLGAILIVKRLLGRRIWRWE